MFAFFIQCCIYKGIQLDDDTSEDFRKIMTEEEGIVFNTYPPGSFQRLFWQQQKEACIKSDKRGMRWHPATIKWCIYLRHQSQKAYETLRSCISLPSQRTLRDYTHCVKSGNGFSTEVDKQLMLAMGESCQEYEKMVVLLMDEMYVKEDIVYNKHTGQLISSFLKFSLAAFIGQLLGFVDMGKINNHLLLFEKQLASDSDIDSPPLAKTTMVFMVKSLFSSFRFAYVQFPCASVSGDLLYQPFWKAVFRLERMDIKV